MKKSITLLLCFIGFLAHCQSWQWGKRGGSTDQLSTTGGDRQEEVYSIVTDSNKNIYTLSYVGKNNLNIDGTVKTNFGDDTTKSDIALSSFSCDGTYRWSKIIGGQGFDRVQSLQIDAQNNIYISGKFGGCANPSFPPRIDDDVILSQTPQDCSVIFIAKYSSDGVMQWFRRPQIAGVNGTEGLSQTFSKGMSTDSLGNSYWLTWLAPGSYANGSFNPTLTGSNFYVLKYDTNGTFVSGTYLDIQLTDYSFLNLQFCRNPYNGSYYMSSTKAFSTDSAVIAGQTVTHAAFLWCFNDLGQFQWLKESTGPNFNTIFWYNYAFDSQNNIYISGYIAGASYENFLGLSPSQFNNPPFVMKFDPSASTVLWTSYPTRGGRQTGAIVLKGSELGVTTVCSGSAYTWGTQTFAPGGTNQGTEVLFARLNKDTGACLSLNKITGDVGYDDVGTALAVDSSGDYILGGGFGHQLTFATNSILNIGSQSDFFVAKYSTSVCSLGTDDFKTEGIELSPNPVEHYVSIEVAEPMDYVVYSLLGVKVKEGKLTVASHQIDFGGLTSGTYVLETTTGAGVVKKAKLLKR